MSGRKNPEPTEAEKTWAYRTHARRSHAVEVAGDPRGDFLDERGPVGEVKEERRERAREDEGEDWKNRPPGVNPA